MCTCVLRLGCFLLACLVLYLVSLFYFQPFLMFTSALNERSMSNPLCDFRLETVVTSDYETPLTLSKVCFFVVKSVFFVVKSVFFCCQKCVFLLSKVCFFVVKSVFFLLSMQHSCYLFVLTCSRALAVCRTIDRVTPPFMCFAASHRSIDHHGPSSKTAAS